MNREVIQKFIREEITVAQAAQMAGISLSAFMSLLSEKRIPFHYTIKELKEECEGL